jgi:hypothetical protein
MVHFTCYNPTLLQALWKLPLQPLLYQVGTWTSSRPSNTMTQQQTTPTLSILGLSLPYTPWATIAECKFPSAWPEDETPLKMPGAWVECDDDDWCQHIFCCIETAFGYDPWCKKDEVVEIHLSGLELWLNWIHTHFSFFVTMSFWLSSCLLPSNLVILDLVLRVHCSGCKFGCSNHFVKIILFALLRDLMNVIPDRKKLTRVNITPCVCSLHL